MLPRPPLGKGRATIPLLGKNKAFGNQAWRRLGIGNTRNKISPWRISFEKNAWRRGNKQLLIEVDCNQRNIPENALPNISLIYTALTEQIALTNDRSNHQVEAIHQRDPNNFWIWFVMFFSQSLKDNFEDKVAELSWTDKNDKKYIYSVRTKGTPERLLITINSSPLIDDDELRDVFRKWGMVKRITHRGHDFAPYIDSGLRRVFLHLHQGVPEEIPVYITLSDGVSRKLNFRGEKYVCLKCSAHHTYSEGCTE